MATERVVELAATFEQANAAAIAAVEGLCDAGWQQVTSEGWTVAACAHHAASVQADIARFIVRFAEGASPIPSGMAEVDEANAKHAAEYAHCSKAETLRELRSQGMEAAELLRGLSNDQIDRRAVAVEGYPAVTTPELVEMTLIGHLRMHLDSIRQAINPVRSVEKEEQHVIRN